MNGNTFKEETEQQAAKLEDLSEEQPVCHGIKEVSRPFL
jgi:MFS family permease